MVNFFQQIFLILTTPPGNLVYHLVLVFAVIGAIPAALSRQRNPDFPQARRALLGLGLLLIGQAILFVSSGLTWQGIFDPQVFLPPLARAVTLFSLVWIIWLWAFPLPARIADSATALLNLLVVILLAFTLSIWGPVATVTTFNGTWLSFGWELISILVVLIGGSILSLRRPALWEYGLGMLGLLLVGHVVEMFAPYQSGDYSGAVRLTQLAAYPLLLMLSGRFSAAPVVASQAEPHQAGVERRRYSADPKATHAFLALAAEDSPLNMCTAVTKAVGQAMLADLCYLIAAPDSQGSVTLQGGYDLIREEPQPGATLEKKAIPQLANALQKGRPFKIGPGTTSLDLQGLGDAINIKQPGSLLVAPLMGSTEVLGGVLLLSPYSNRVWNSEDQAYLTSLTETLVHILQRSERARSLQENLETARLELDGSKSELEALRQELGQVPPPPEDAGPQPTVEENPQPITADEEPMPAAGSEEREIGYFEDELRQSLKENAYLQNELAEAKMKIMEIERHASIPAPPTSEPSEVIASMAQELRQPMSSIMGYTHLLLGESVGILGALQRNFLERINASTQRLGRLIDDLIRVTVMDSGQLELLPETVDLGGVIDYAMASTSAQLREKNITLRLDLPEEMPVIHADRDGLQQILVHLLQNAGSATPADGVIILKVNLQSENGQSFVLLQITDSGGGIPAEEIPRVFSRLYRADNPLIQGMGDTGVGLSIAKTLVESHGGRIWVDTEAGFSSTFSVLLPVNVTSSVDTGKTV